MRSAAAALIVLVALAVSVHAQHEYAPIEKKDIEYKDWTYRNASGEGKTHLRDFVKGKKLVLVFYFAPWCHSSRFEAPILQRFFEEYSDKGLGIIGVSNYDTEEALNYELKTRNLTFPVVIETTALSARQKSDHYKYRWSTGDHRKWGTPWNIFLFPSELSPKGDTLLESTYVANGELIEAEAESFIRDHLGLPPLPDQPKKAMKKDEKVFVECQTNDQVSGIKDH